MDHEITAIRKIYALPDTCTLRDVADAFFANPCERAQKMLIYRIDRAINANRFCKIDSKIKLMRDEIAQIVCKY